MVARFLMSIVAVSCAGRAVAHPFPRDTHDRTITVSLNPAAVLIEYHLEVDAV